MASGKIERDASKFIQLVSTQSYNNWNPVDVIKDCLGVLLSQYPNLVGSFPVWFQNLAVENFYGELIATASMYKVIVATPESLFNIDPQYTGKLFSCTYERSTGTLYYNIFNATTSGTK